MKEILSPTVISALVAAAVSFVICVINNRYVSKIEERKQKDRIRTFRYQTLYSFLQSSIGDANDVLDPKTPRNQIDQNAEKRYLFDRNQYFKIRSLLDETYRNKLDPLFLESYKTIDKMNDLKEIAETPFATEEEKAQYRAIYYKFYREASQIREELQETIQQQIIDLV